MSRRRRRILLGLLTAGLTLGVSGSTSAFEFNGNPPWPGDPAVIEYNAAFKGNGDKWAMKKAAEAWSQAGPEVRFQSVRREDAEVLIRYNKLPCSRAGFTIISFPPMRAEVNVGRCKGLGKYQQVQLLTHELGHVLGLDHEDSGCATMNSRTEFQGSASATHPFKCPAPPAGSWRCRLLTTDDVEGIQELYGGTVEAPGPESCRLRG